MKITNKSLILYILIVFFSSCMKKDSSKKLTSNQDKSLDYEKCLKEVANADYAQLNLGNLKPTTHSIHFILIKKSGMSSIYYYDFDSKALLKSLHFNGDVKNNMYIDVDSKLDFVSSIFTVVEKNKAYAKIVKYNTKNKVMETIFDYPIIIQDSGKISLVNYIDVLNSKETPRDTISIYKGKLLNDNFQNEIKIRRKGNTILKRFIYNHNIERFEEEISK